MKNRTKILIAIIVIMAILINAFAYIGIINGSNAFISMIKKINFSNGHQKKPQLQNNTVKQLQNLILDKSNDFINAAFSRDDERIIQLLDPSAKYIRSKDNSSFIRYVENGVFVEGYMATDKKLKDTNQRWYVVEKDYTITCSMEVYLEGSTSPMLWYLHFRKVKDDWKIYMLENDI